MREYQKSGDETVGCTADRRNPDTDDRIILNLRDLSHVMRALYEGKGSQKRVLIVLQEMGGQATQRALTERLGIQPGSASEVIAKLENAGCITRRPSETDRRTSDVALTDAGRACAQEARAQRSRRHAEMFACLSAEEKTELLALLEKINADWSARYPGAKHGRGRRDHAHRRGEGA